MDKKNRKQLRNLLLEGEKSSCFSWKIKKKGAPKQLYKATTENIPHFNRDQFFIITKVVKNSDNQYNYWVAKVKKKINTKHEIFKGKNC